MPPRKHEGGTSISRTANSPLATSGMEIASPSRITASMRVTDVVSIFRLRGGAAATS